MSTGTDHTPAAAPSGPITLDQFAAELVAEAEVDADAPPQVDDEDEEQKAAPEEVEASAEAEEPEAELEAEAEAEEDPEPEAEVVPPPQSWSKEDREAWAALTPEAQKVVLKRESDRDRAVAQAVQQASELTKSVQEFARRSEEYAHLGADQFEQRWQEKAKGPINWAHALNQAQTQDEFQEILRQKAVYDAEKTELEAAQKRAKEQSELARNAFLAHEWKELERIAPELADPKEGKARREKVYSYLEAAGVPREALPDLSAIELNIAWKAARYDEMTAKAKEQTKLPRKNPSAPVPKPVKASGVGDASPQRNLQALSQKLSRSGKLDDFVSLMVAEDEQKARKKAR